MRPLLVILAVVALAAVGGCSAPATYAVGGAKDMRDLQSASRLFTGNRHGAIVPTIAI